MRREYQARPDGLSGNDDTGQMSAWYVFSTLGFYPVCPDRPYYVLGAPQVPEVRIHLTGNNAFLIRARGISQSSIYIRKATLNGKPYDRPWIAHQDIVNGGLLLIWMDKKPNLRWAAAPEKSPPEQ